MDKLAETKETVEGFVAKYKDARKGHSPGCACRTCEAIREGNEALLTVNVSDADILAKANSDKQFALDEAIRSFQDIVPRER